MFNSIKGIADWAVSASEANTQKITSLRDVDAPMADRALEIVRKFISERGLILYGGQAVDYALQLCGDSIYPLYQRPDFDFYSPNHVRDAYDLADILSLAGFKQVGAIRAIHLQTMRVKSDFVFVADISYAPPSVFSRLPTLSYSGMRFLHPDFQRMDMHLAFCFPFNDPPREDIFNRASKDLKRLRLLQHHYPITSGSVLAVGSKMGGRALVAPCYGLAHLSLTAVHGFAAYGVLRSALDCLFTSAKAVSCVNLDALDSSIPHLPVSVCSFEDDKNLVSVSFVPPNGLSGCSLDLATSCPVDVASAILSKKDTKLQNKVPEVQWYSPYMDSRPATAVIASFGKFSDVTLHSTQNRLLSISSVLHGDGAPFLVQLVSPQYLLLYFLHGAFDSGLDAERRTVYTSFYAFTLKVMAEADRLFAHMKSCDPSPGDGRLDSLIASSPFYLPLRTLGDLNHNEAYLIHMKKSAQIVGANTDVGERIVLNVPSLHNVPANYFPPKTRPPSFDYDLNVAFLRDGLVVDRD
jgi:hypothetical protein